MSSKELTYEKTADMLITLRKSFKNLKLGKNAISRQQSLAWTCEAIDFITEPLAQTEKFDIIS